MNFISRAVLLLTCLSLFHGQLIQAAGAEDEAEGPIFYPPPPDMPRFQVLATYSSALDVESDDKGLKGFLFGDTVGKQSLIQKPYGAALHDGKIHVVDSRGFGWGVFDVAKGGAYFVQPTGGGTLRKPINMTIDADGTKYVTDTDRLQVVVFNASDQFVAAFGEGEQFRPVDVAISGDRLYVTDAMHHMVHVLDKHSGETLFTFGEKGSAPGSFIHPTGIGIASDGSVYVVDTTNYRVQRFSPEGDFEFAFGGQGVAAGRFVRPKSVAIDKEDHVYVVDAAFQNVQVIEAETGGALMAFGRTGEESDSINVPTVVKIDYDDVEHFEHLAAPGFNIEYLVLVVGQFGPNKVLVLGFGSFDE